MEKVVVEMKDITKIFPGTIANKDINFELYERETHVLLGENGAGKTTLMNILYGLYEPEKGEVFIKGEKVKKFNPNTAIKMGIGMVHQHFMLVKNFTVYENVILGEEPKKGIKIDKQGAIKNIAEFSRKYGFNIDVNAKIEDISVGQQQKVEIIKALYRGAEILILDEPTAVLTPQEIDELGIIINNLKEQGKSVILITHKLKEVMKMSDRVTIIRRGEVIDTVKTEDTNINELAELMVGRKVNLTVDKNPPKIKEEVLKVKGITVKDIRGLDAVKNLSLSLRGGEVLGIAGVDANGQSELIEAITGLNKVVNGEIELLGKRIENLSPKKIIDSKVSHVPEDRHKRGLVLKFPLYENSILGIHNYKKFKSGKLLNYDGIRKYSKKLINDFDVRTPNENVEASALSGGNQQKLIVAREFSKEPKLLIVAQPTRGLDVGSIEYIHKRIIEARDAGTAVLLVSLELDEIMSLSDRIAVMYQGEIVDTLNREDATEQKLGILMAGGKITDKEVKDIEH